MKYTRSEAKAWCKEHVVDFYECPLTPMTKDMTLDEPGIRENIEAYVQMGHNVLVVGGFLAECWNLKLSDWMRYHEIVVDANKGRLDLWTIILDPSVHKALEKMQFVEKLGYNGAEVINPVMQLRGDNEVYNYFKYMSDHSNLALWLYRTPVSGKVLSLEPLQRLSDIGTIVGVKQGSLNYADTIKIRSKMRPDFVVSEPAKYFYLQDLRNGGQVLWGGFTYIIYGKKLHLLKEYANLARTGKWEEAYGKWAELQPVRDLMDELFTDHIAKTASYAGAVPNVKAWYEALGFKAGPAIPPVENLSPAEKERIKARIKEAGIA